MSPRPKSIIALLIITLSVPHLGADEARIWLHAKINGKTAKLAFDSGADALALSPGGLKRLGIRFIPAATNDFPGEVRAGTTEEVSLKVEGMGVRTTFFVLNLGAWEAADFDGLVGWFFLARNIWRIDAPAGRIAFIDDLPKKVLAWQCFCLVTNSGALDLEIPDGANTNRVLCIDTGSPGGVALPATEWRTWKQTHPDVPLTLETMSSPSDGFYVQERAWSDYVAVGPLILRGVPVEQAGPAGSARWGSRYAGTLGLAALKRLDFIVDGPKGLAYLHIKEGRPQIPEHNRLGAVFVPTTEHTNQAVARVLAASPAYQAGIRNGDILVGVDGVKATSWHSGWLGRFQMSPGTKLRMTLTRDGKEFTTTAVLRDIVSPSKDSPR